MDTTQTIATLAAKHNIKAGRGLRHYVSRKVSDGWSFERIEAGARKSGLLRTTDAVADHWANGGYQS